MRVIILNGSPKAHGNTATTPVYFASPNGTLLSLLDRLFYSNLHTDWSMKVGASAVRIAEDSGRINRNTLYQIKPT